MNLKLSGKVQTAIAAGATAIAIAGAMLSGNDGLEGRRYTPYFDVAGVLTVCDGHTGKDIIGNKKYSDSECDAFLRADLKTVADGIDPVIKVSLPETTRAALYSFTYNVGVGAFKKSTLLVKLNQGDIAGACDQLHRWVYAGGKPWKGLMNRREVEHAVCTWPQHEIPLVEVDGKLTAVEPPRQPDPARWFVLVVGGLMAGLVAGMGYTLWKLRQLMRSKDREPRPADKEND